MQFAGRSPVAASDSAAGLRPPAHAQQPPPPAAPAPARRPRPRRPPKPTPNPNPQTYATATAIRSSRPSTTTGAAPFSVS